MQRANCALTHTFGCIIYFTGVGIQTLFVLSGRLPTAEIAERAGEDTPLFVCGSTAITNLSGTGVSVGNLIVVG